jgi:hypothetical protein
VCLQGEEGGLAVLVRFGYTTRSIAQISLRVGFNVESGLFGICCRSDGIQA